MDISMLPDYMKIIDMEEVKNSLHQEFDADETEVKKIMDLIEPCILDEEEIKNQERLWI